MRNIKKLLTIVLAIICVSCFGGAVVAFADTESESTSVIKYIKNSYTAGAFMYEEEGYLRYGIPLSADEKEYQWELIDHDGNYEIKNVATGHSITSIAEGEKFVRNIAEFTMRDLWRIDASLPYDESQIFKIAENDDMALHIIEADDGYVVCEKLGSNYTYGEAKWCLFDAAEISFAGVIRDGFCIGDGTGKYLTADGLVFGTPTGPDDYYIWELKLQSDGTKTFYNVGTKQYLAVSGNAPVLVGEAQAMHFATYATNQVTIVGDNNAVLTKIGSSLTIGSNTASASAKFNVVLASAVGTVLGDLKLDGIYTFSNSWFNMYMLDDGGVATYGNSAPNNTQIQWEVNYDAQSGYSAIKNVGRDEYLIYDESTKVLSFSKNIQYIWKVLRNSNDLYPEAIRFNYMGGKIFLHMENLSGQLECDSSVQATWGSPHWEAVKFDETAKPTMESATVETNKWFRLKSAYSENLYFYQTNGGYAYNSVAEKDGRSHWQFIKDGNDYLLYNRNFELYVGSFGNGYLTKTDNKESATKFGVNKYLSDGTYLIYEKNEKDYLSQYINIKNRDSMIYLSLVSVDIKETRWILEEAPKEIESNDIVVNNTVLPTFTEDARYQLDGYSGLRVEHYSSFVRVCNKDGKYLTVDSNGKTSWKKFTHDYDTDFYFNYETAGDDLTLTRGDTTLLLKQTATDRKFMFNNGLVVGNASTISVYAAQSKEYTVKLHTMITGVKNDVYVDGVFATSFTSGEASQIKLSLHKGNNLIKFTRADAVDNITIKNIISNSYQGAAMGITAYELENYRTNANVEVDARSRWSMTAEASGRSFILLENVTEYVEFTLVNDANAFTLRYSVPDTADGAGKSYTLSMYINGKDKGNLTLTSEYTHLYGTWDYTNNPEDGYHHVYFDELTYKFDETVPAGTTIRLRRDFDDEASYYALDLFETEIIPEMVEKPANALSLADYRRDGLSDYDALVACINDAVKQGKEVYIPAGVYEMGKKNSNYKKYTQNVSSLEYANNTLNVSKNNVTIIGAGYWYTEIRGLQFEVNADNLSVYSLKLAGYANTRNDTGERACFDGGSAHTGLTLANLWIVHYKVGAWLTDKCDTFISGNRIRYTYADGVNFQAGEKTGTVNCVVENNSVRSTGDDGLAAWSEKNSDKDIIYRNNTVESPWHANCIVLYGGGDISIYNNVCKDTAYRGAGVNISTDFEPVNFNGRIIVENNLIIRCGGDNEDSNKKIGGIWFNMLTGYDSFAEMYVRNNVILNSTYQGISFEQTSIICSLILQENVIVNSGSYGIEFSSDVHGNVFVKNNSISGSALEDILDNHREDNATIMFVDDEVVINTNSGSLIALWCVAGVMLAGAAALAAGLTVVLLKKAKKEDK